MPEQREGTTSTLDGDFFRRWAEGMGGDEEQAMLKLLEAFRCDHPEAKIDYVQVADDPEVWTRCQDCGLTEKWADGTCFGWRLT